MWGGLFSTFDCAVKGIRKKEDPYNASESFLCYSVNFYQIFKNDAQRVQLLQDFLLEGL